VVESAQAIKQLFFGSQVSADPFHKTYEMRAEIILTNVAILFLVTTFWNYLQQEARLTPARRTWLSVAGIFALVSVLLQLFGR
jgi:hypothetical protein